MHTVWGSDFNPTVTVSQSNRQYLVYPLFVDKCGFYIREVDKNGNIGLRRYPDLYDSSATGSNVNVYAVTPNGIVLVGTSNTTSTSSQNSQRIWKQLNFSEESGYVYIARLVDQNGKFGSIPDYCTVKSGMWLPFTSGTVYIAKVKVQ